MFSISAAAIAFLKKILIQAALDEETRKNLFIVLISILVIVTILLLVLVSFPVILISILFGSTVESNPTLLDDIARVAIYQDTIYIVDQLNQEWIADAIAENSNCDEFEIIYNYNLTWQELISIDSVLLNQDFKKMNANEIQEIALKFLIRSVNVSEKEVEEEYEEEEEYEVNVIGNDGKPKTTIKTRTVTKTRIIKIKVCTIRIDTRDFESVLPDVNITTKEDVFIATNILNTISSMNVEGNLNIYDSVDLADLQEYPEGYANLPYYNQTDIRWGANSYGNTTILDGGCGPTSLAMIVSGLTGQKITPDIVANWSYENGHRAEGQGSYWSLMTAGGSYYGLNVEQVSRKDPNSIVRALSEGYPIVVSMGKGNFTNGGHFIVLRGITADGKILVHDSASVERSNKEWDLSIIMNESSTNGGTAGSPFWIFKP